MGWEVYVRNRSWPILSYAGICLGGSEADIRNRGLPNTN